MQEGRQQSKVLVVVASTRPGRIGRAIADWFYEQAREQATDDVQVELVDLADWNLPLLDEPVPAKANMYQHAHTKQWSAKITEAAGYIIVTPEYNHGYPASLKNALDYLYHEWVGKPVVFVSYGMGGGQLAVEQLRQIAGALQMDPLAEQLSIPFEHNMFDERHQLVDPDASLAKYSSAARGLTQALITKLKITKEHVHETA